MNEYVLGDLVLTPIDDYKYEITKLCELLKYNELLSRKGLVRITIYDDTIIEHDIGYKETYVYLSFDEDSNSFIVSGCFHILKNVPLGSQLSLIEVKNFCDNHCGKNFCICVCNVGRREVESLKEFCENKNLRCTWINKGYKWSKIVTKALDDNDPNYKIRDVSYSCKNDNRKIETHDGKKSISVEALYHEHNDEDVQNMRNYLLKKIAV